MNLMQSGDSDILSLRLDLRVESIFIAIDAVKSTKAHEKWNWNKTETKFKAEADQIVLFQFHFSSPHMWNNAETNSQVGVACQDVMTIWQLPLVRSIVLVVILAVWYGIISTSTKARVEFLVENVTIVLQP